MPLKSALESILIDYLSPYLHGVTRDKISTGFYSGELELKQVRVKAEALRLLGFESLSVTQRSDSDYHIESIKLLVPWSSLWTGKVWIYVESVHLELEQIRPQSKKDQDDLRAALQKEKQDAIKQKLEGMLNENNHDELGFTGRLFRKILQNFCVRVTGVELLLINRKRGVTVGFKGDELALVSTDEHFHEDEREVVELAGGEIYKVMHMKEVGILLSTGFDYTLNRAEWLMQQISWELRVTSIPEEQYLEITVKFATDKECKLIMMRKYIKHLFNMQADLAKEREKMRALVVPPDVDMQIKDNPEEALDEYRLLYEKYLEERIVVNDAEHWQNTRQELEEVKLEVAERLQLLEDALPAVLVARQQYAVKISQTDPGQSDSLSHAHARSVLVTEDFVEEHEELKEAVLDNCRELATDLSRMNFELQFGPLLLELNDDRYDKGEERYSVMSAATSDTLISIFVNSGVDDETMQLQVDVHFGAFRSKHAHQLWAEFFGAEHTGAAPNLSFTELEHAISPRYNFVRRADSNVTSIKGRRAGRVTVEQISGMLKLGAEFAPLQVFCLKGAVGRFLEFWKLPERDDDDGGERGADIDGINKSSLDGLKKIEDLDRIIKLSGGILQTPLKRIRIPDTLFFELVIASPIFHIPCKDEDGHAMGFATMSLGTLRGQTPRPCPYQEIAFNVEFTDTVLRTTLPGDRHFDIIPQLRLDAGFDIQLREEETAVKIDSSVVGVRKGGRKAQEELADMTIMLAPQALQILLAVPATISACMEQEERDTAGADVRPKLTVHRAFSGRLPKPLMTPEDDSRAKSEAQAASYSLGDSRHAFLRRQGSATLARTNSLKLVREASPSLNRSVSFKVSPPTLLQEGAAEKYRELEKRVSKAREANTKVEFGLKIQNLTVTLASATTTGSIPMMKLGVGLSNSHRERSAITVVSTSTPSKMVVDVPGQVSMFILNLRNGEWEPVIEPVDLNFKMENEENQAVRSRSISIKAHSPLLLDVAPTAVQTMKSLLQGMTCKEEMSSEKAGYQVFNLSEHSFEILMMGRSGGGRMKRVDPTGSSHESLDSIMTESRQEGVDLDCASLVRVRVLSGEASDSQYSDVFSLDSPGLVRIPRTQYIAQVYVPQYSHRVLLLAGMLCVHNQTELPLQVQFYVGEETPAQHSRAMVCDAACFGDVQQPARHKFEQLSKPEQWQAEIGLGHEMSLLEPNCLCYVPSLAIHRGAAHKRQAWLKIRPVGVSADFSELRKVGEDIGLHACTCSLTEAALPSRRAAMHFRLEPFQPRRHFQSDRTQIHYVAVRPPLVLTNALPMNRILVQYRSNGTASSIGSSIEVPPLTRFSLYDASCTSDATSQIVHTALLSNNDEVTPSAISTRNCSHSTDDWQTISISRVMTADVIGTNEMRFVCHTWLTDRSGLEAPFRLELHYNRSRLFSVGNSGRVWLLPAKCYEQVCQVVLFQGAKEITCVDVCMPTSHDRLTFNTPHGPYFFCLQVDRVAPGDVLGTNCSVITLRPSIVVTNVSEDVTIEVQPCSQSLPDSTRTHHAICLKPRQSKALHWPGDASGYHPKTVIQFRPVRECAVQWSSRVIVSRSFAGSTPYILTSEEDKEIWSVEIVPNRGALAISFRQSSDYVAKNNTFDKHLLVMPYPPGPGCQRFGLYPGTEMEYGWSTPMELKKSQRRSVQIAIDGKTYTVDDVHRTQKIEGLPADMVLQTTRRGEQTLLVLDDKIKVGQQKNAGKASTFHINVSIDVLGLSLIEESPKPHELLYIQLRLMRFDRFVEDGKVDRCNLVIEDAQMDCQLPAPVDSVKYSPVVFIKSPRSSEFLYISFELGATSSRDTLLKQMEASMGTLDVNVDNHWLDAFISWLGHFASEDWTMEGFRLESITDGKPLTDDYKPPPLCPVLEVESMNINAINLEVWCKLQLTSLRPYLPAFALNALRVLSLGNVFTLDGQWIQLRKKNIPAYRGSFDDFWLAVWNQYSLGLLRHTASVLGKSKVLNLPGPVWLSARLVGGIGRLTGCCAEVGQNVTTLDRQARAEQMRKRREKIASITGMRTGCHYFIASLASAVCSPCDACAKWKLDSGKKACLPRTLQCCLDSTVKPVLIVTLDGSESVCAGISSSLGGAARGASREKFLKHKRLRPARLIMGDLGVVRIWSLLEACLVDDLGESALQGVVEVCRLKALGHLRIILLLFKESLAISVVFAKTDIWDSDIRTAGLPAPYAQMLKTGATTDIQKYRISRQRSFAISECELMHRSLQLSDLAGDTYVIVLDEFLFEQASANSNPNPRLSNHATWLRLRQAMKLTRQDKLQREERESRGESFGKLKLVVVEVERRLCPLCSWRTPFLPIIDKHARSRWLDLGFQQHPCLDPGGHSASFHQEPPVRPRNAFHAAAGSAWEIAKRGEEDDDGWSYSTFWKSVEWEDKCRLIHCVRKRHWHKTFE